MENKLLIMLAVALYGIESVVAAHASFLSSPDWVCMFAGWLFMWATIQESPKQ